MIDSTDAATVPRARISGNFDASSAGSNPVASSPSTLIYHFLATSGVRNYGGYSNPRVDSSSPTG